MATPVYTHRNDDGTEYRFPTLLASVKRFVETKRIDYPFWHFINDEGTELSHDDVIFLYNVFC